MLAALQARLGVGNDMVFKSASALAGGVAGMGDSCGALVGALMGIGCVVGRDRLEDVDQARKARAPAQEAYHRFREEVGHTICAEIQKIKYGQRFRSWIPEERRAFLEAGGHSRTGCPQVCGIAARIAGGLILQLRSTS